MTLGSRDCLSSLEIEGEPSVEDLQSSLAALAEAGKERASATQIAKALAVLTAVCAKPADFDDAKVVLWSERLKIVLQEFPASIAMHAVSEWPKSQNGKWWPTEHEIRIECNAAMHFRYQLRHELECLLERMQRVQIAMEEREAAPPRLDGMSDEPTGAVAAYIEELRAIRPEHFDAYFKYARFGEGVIGTTFSSMEGALERAAPGLMDKHGVRIVRPVAMSRDGVAEWPQ